jgi:hypothetical protein
MSLTNACRADSMQELRHHVMPAMPGGASTKVKILPQMRIPVRAGAASHYAAGPSSRTRQTAGYADTQSRHVVPSTGTISRTAAYAVIPAGSTTTDTAAARGISTTSTVSDTAAHGGTCCSAAQLLPQMRSQHRPRTRSLHRLRSSLWSQASGNAAAGIAASPTDATTDIMAPKFYGTAAAHNL